MPNRTQQRGKVLIGWPVNAKRVDWLCREEGVTLRTNYRKKRVNRNRVTPAPAERPNERWSMDFMTDALLDGRRFRVFTVVDTMSRVRPAIEAAFFLKGEQVVAVLERLKGTMGTPKRLAVDNASDGLSSMGRSAFRRRWMHGRTERGCNWRSRAPARRRTTPLRASSASRYGTVPRRPASLCDFATDSATEPATAIPPVPYFA